MRMQRNPTGAGSKPRYRQMALTLHNKRWYPFIFLIVVAAVIAVVHFAPAAHRPELLLSTVGGVAGFFYFLYRQHLDQTKLFKELFVEFNARYDALKGYLNAILFGPADGLLSPDEREHIFEYFNLCAEEYFFFTAGYIDRHVWESWCRGMNVFFEQPRIRALWEQDCKADSYYGFQPSVSGRSKRD
jgi:hypothetical protein